MDAKKSSEEIKIVENKNIAFQTGGLSNRNEIDVIDGIRIVNPLINPINKRIHM